MRRMQTAESNPLSTFLECFTKVREAGLIVAENRLQLAKAHAVLSAYDFYFAKSWSGTMRQLALDVPVAALISTPFPREFFETVQQYQRRSGIIQIMDRETLEP